MSFDTNAAEMSTAHMFDAQAQDMCEPQDVELPTQNLDVATIQNVGASLEGHGPSVAANANTMNAISSPAAEIFSIACNSLEKGLSNAGVTNSQEGIKLAPEVPEQNPGMDIDAANDANYHSNLAMAAPTPGMSV